MFFGLLVLTVGCGYGTSYLDMGSSRWQDDFGSRVVVYGYDDEIDEPLHRRYDDSVKELAVSIFVMWLTLCVVCIDLALAASEGSRWFMWFPPLPAAALLLPIAFKGFTKHALVGAACQATILLFVLTGYVVWAWR